MNIRHFFISLLFPVMVMCTPVQPQDQSNENNNQGNNPEIIDADAAVAPEVKDGDRILVTNEIVQKFLSEITYPERDYTYSAMKKGEEVDFLKYQYVDEDDGETKTRLYISPGQCDIPPKYTVRWPKDTKSDKYTGKLWEGDWSAEYDLTPDPDSEVSFGYWEIRNLRPNAHYNFEVKNGSETVTSGQFDTYGLLHQLIFKPGSGSGVRNVRDLGGWKTKDGSKTVKYRKIYRGGRPEAINKAGVQEAKAEGIKAELDLRGWSYEKNSDGSYKKDDNGNKIKKDHDFLSESPFEGAIFLAPEIDEGYAQMLRDDKEKTRMVMQFIMDCVKQDKPVYFHCSLGRDRTGTTAMLVLGILGVNEGDISKEYELTQFAPSGYSISTGEKTRMTRLNGVDYDGAAKFIWNYAKKDDGSYGEFKEGVEKYLLEIGISQQDINDFRSNMLQ